MRGRNVALGAAGLAAFLALGEAVPRLGLVKEAYFPPTSRIAEALTDEVSDSAFWSALGDTLTGWALGLAIAVCAGVVAGVVISVVPYLREATASTIEFLRPIPSVALIPLAVLLYGTELKSVLLLVVYASFWQVLIQTLYGVQDVDPVAEETARSYGLGTWARVRHVLWPTALPYVMTGVRLAAAVAQTSQAVPQMYALIVVAGLLGLLINVGARTVERRALAWHQSVRGEVAV
jgi:ABC-type nitrate/sulfonate/bicarbonate transport system permease component